MRTDKELQITAHTAKSAVPASEDKTSEAPVPAQNQISTQTTLAQPTTTATTTTQTTTTTTTTTTTATTTTKILTVKRPAAH